VNAIDKAAAKAEMKEQEEREKREMDAKRERDQEEFKRQNKKALKNVVKPTYKLDTRLNVYRELDIPPDSLFEPLGYDIEPEDKRKHYRRYYKSELELTPEVMPVPTPFQQYEIKKGQARGASAGFSLFGSGPKTDESGSVSTEQVMGKFKGIVTVQSLKEKDDYAKTKSDKIETLKNNLSAISLKQTGKPFELDLEMMDSAEGRAKFSHEMQHMGVAHLKITKHLADLESDETLKRLLNQINKCVVRIYIVSAYNLASRDNGGFSDPYCIVKCGRKVYNERDNYQEDEPNPGIYKSFDFEATFPGAPPIELTLMDYDLIFGDESIGTTLIDLEDRFFSPDWQAFQSKPIEYRKLTHPSSQMSQGVVKLWVEIWPTAIPMNEIPIFDISPKPVENFEVRVVVWDTIDIAMMDAEGTSDVFFRIFFDSNHDKETDCHYRCQNGKASFNYRLLFDATYPQKEYKLTVQAYDRDFFKSNDLIGEHYLDLSTMFEDTSLARRPMSFSKDYYKDCLSEKVKDVTFKDDTSFWVPLKKLDEET